MKYAEAQVVTLQQSTQAASIRMRMLCPEDLLTPKPFKGGCRNSLSSGGCHGCRRACPPNESEIEDVGVYVCACVYECACV